MKTKLAFLLTLSLCFSCGENTKTSPDAQQAAIEKQNKEVMQRFIDGLNQKNWDELVGFSMKPADFDDYRQYHGVFRQAFPDYHFTPEIMLAKGDTVVTIGMVTATHAGEFKDKPFTGIAATGKKLQWKEVWVTSIIEGKFNGGYMFSDAMSILDQLDVNCPPVVEKK